MELEVEANFLGELETTFHVRAWDDWDSIPDGALSRIRQLVDWEKKEFERKRDNRRDALLQERCDLQNKDGRNQTLAVEPQEVKAWLKKDESHLQWDEEAILEYLVDLAEIFNRISQDQHRDMMSEFHNLAGRMPYFQDKDIGAIILEATADSITDKELRIFLYAEARLRARWCAETATAGGEGLAKAHHIKELDQKIRKTALDP